MKKLNYIIEESTIAEVLGLQNYTIKESAILELIKNSYDAGAFNVQLNFVEDDNYINLFYFDDGSGMNEDDLKTKWMHIGKSYRTYTFIDSNNNTRVYSGSKGIGRFALARLAEIAQIYTKTENDSAVHWFTDWNSISYENTTEYVKKGTTIKLFRLRDKWNEIQIKNLTNYLSRTCNTELMSITINFNGNSYQVNRYFSNEKIGLNYSSKINFKYDASSNIASIDVKMDEFKEKAANISRIDIKGFSKNINLFQLLESNYSKTHTDDELKSLLTKLGDFSGNLYFALDSDSIDVERFLYKKRKYTLNRSDIILYRNAFSISGYDGKKDWLALNQRSRKSPAAATHKTGKWRVRSNQITGSVFIDKKNNPELQDLSNRQGLNENESFELFKLIIDKIISEFEKYRQSIIRQLHTYNESKSKKKASYSSINKLLRTKQDTITLSGENLSKLQKEVSSLKSRNKELVNEGKEVESNLKYEVQILNILATVGLKSTSIAHQINNKKNFLYDYYDAIVNRLKEKDLWDKIIEISDTSHFYKDVAKMLSTNYEISLWMIKFMETALDEISKDKFIIKQINIQNVISTIKDTWEFDYSWLSINIDAVEDITLTSSLDTFNVIFDNLLLNTVQQNINSKLMQITISAYKNDDYIYFVYKDNGVGLSEKYLKDPFKILEVHETNRYDGHGLGMWIVHNTLLSNDGDINDISSKEGFQIEFYIKDLGENENV